MICPTSRTTAPTWVNAQILVRAKETLNTESAVQQGQSEEPADDKFLAVRRELDRQAAIVIT
jgi:hypothetical protein